MLVHLVVSDAAAELIREQGGRLYVWPQKARCCGALTTLRTASDPPAGKQFRRVTGTDQLDVFFPTRLARLPQELHVDVRRFPRRVEAYWNGCAWVA